MPASTGSRSSDAFNVSVILPVYNGEAYIAEAVRSICAQDTPVLEIVIVDDGSTDDTAKVVERLGGPMRLLQQPNRGAAAARNRGLAAAVGEVIAFLDADDLWTPHRLSLQLDKLRADPALNLVRGHTQRIHWQSDPSGIAGWQPVGESWPALSLGATVARRQVFDSVGGFDESLALNEDVDWFLRAQQAGIPGLVHDDLVQYYRRHEGNITNDRELNKTFFLRALKNTIARKRSSGE